MLTDFENRIWELVRSLSPKTHEFAYKRRTAFRYLFAGGTAVLADVGALYIAKGVLDIPLIPAVALAFLVGFAVSFSLQKFWTFEESSIDRMHSQAAMYLTLAVINFLLNIVLMYLLVEVVGIWYILAKILVAGSIAIGSFFIYKKIIFLKRG